MERDDCAISLPYTEIAKEVYRQRCVRSGRGRRGAPSVSILPGIGYVDELVFQVNDSQVDSQRESCPPGG